MNVFAFYSPDDPHPLTRLWVKSWAARGWIPRLILPSETATGLTPRQVANRRGGGPVVLMEELNFSRKPKSGHPTKRIFGHSGWQDADTVCFAHCSEDEVLHCGRPLNAD